MRPPAELSSFAGRRLRYVEATGSVHNKTSCGTVGTSIHPYTLPILTAWPLRRTRGRPLVGLVQLGRRAECAPATARVTGARRGPPKERHVPARRRGKPLAQIRKWQGVSRMMSHGVETTIPRSKLSSFAGDFFDPLLTLVDAVTTTGFVAEYYGRNNYFGARYTTGRMFVSQRFYANCNWQ
jgi:hypothetical protein